MAKTRSPKLCRVEPRLDALTLRPYQKGALNALLRGWRLRKHALVVVAQGGGKSLIGAEAALMLAQFGRVLAIVPNQDLLLQNLEAVRRQEPDAKVTICCAALGVTDDTGAIVLCTPGSVVRRDLSTFDVVLIDEAHRLPARSDAMLRKIIASVKSGAPVLGMTATPFRMSGRLDNGDPWTEIDYRIDYLDLLKLGLAAPLVGPRNASLYKMDVTGVRKTAGDFNEADLARKLGVDSVTAAVAKEIVAWAETRKTGITFCVSVKAAHDMAKALRGAGLSARAVDGSLRPEDRNQILADFRAGKIQALCACGLLTEGFDAPGVDWIALARPTMSATLHAQMLGRGTRTSAGKTDALILDFAENIRRLGTIDDIRVAGDTKEQPAAPKTCPECGFINRPGAKTCAHCDHEFPVEEKPRSTAHIKLRADAAEPVRNIERAALPPHTYRVTGASYAVHEKPGAADSLRITYGVEGWRFRSVSMWLACWHDRNPWRARERWAAMLTDEATRRLPLSASDAAEKAQHMLRRPSHVNIRPDENGRPVVTPIFGGVK